MKVLTEQELKQAAEELGMDATEVKTMYERALAQGSGPLGLKEFKEVALKTNGAGGQNAAKKDKLQEEMDEETQKKALKAIIADLDLGDYAALKEILTEVEDEVGIAVKGGKIGMSSSGKAGGTMMDEEEMTEEEKKAAGKKTKEVDERLDKLEQALMQQTKAMTDLLTVMATGGNRQGANDAIANFMANLPRRQASGLLSQTKTVDEVPDDEAVMAKLKSIEEKLTNIQSPGRDIYDLFTSSQLNSKRS